MTARLIGGPDGDLRDRLLLVALEEIRVVGADDLSLRALARKAGVSHQAPIHVFGSRRGLLTALVVVAVNHLAEEMAYAASESEAAHGPGHEVVLAIGLAYLEFALEDQALFLLATRTDALDMTNPALREARDRAWSVLYDAVARAQATGWRAGQPTDLLSLLCWSLVQGVGAIYRDALAPEDLTARTPEQLARALGDLLRD
ncbi:MAG TPA: TetR/AcrR family transcriptional regulator [Nocardioides sp.]|nr:TetR/AcrR family transcriptional regulator [Nocardioides sp.]